VSARPALLFGKGAHLSTSLNSAEVDASTKNTAHLFQRNRRRRIAAIGACMNLAMFISVLPICSSSPKVSARSGAQRMSVLTDLSGIGPHVAARFDQAVENLVSVKPHLPDTRRNVVSERSPEWLKSLHVTSYCGCATVLLLVHWNSNLSTVTTGIRKIMPRDPA
jgi:hypothetical protein